MTLDDWAERVAVREIDFLKLNVQGGELEVLRGAERTLGSVLGVLLEVAFVESYQSRPLFHDVDRFLGEAGFTFFDLLAHHYVGRVESPIAAQHLSIVEPKLGQLVSSWGQLVEGHALYLRDPIGRPSAAMPFARVLKLIALAETWGQIEFAFELLAWLNRASDLVDGPTAERVQTIIERGADEYLSYLRPGVPRPNSSR